ncbi:hypothetical protein CQA66_02200 [Helicobacter aurati]|uniref:Uncharacterized protein n=1 Tax=Helicobacter aurati TaxID=137778 RepID=A0A3D8J7H3_9HELI|nr:hypothetical protein [Helicobacter aurati]RDU73066.1 hypothetical protein CQA66_02200 [Helicobacter aurati]
MTRNLMLYSVLHICLFADSLDSIVIEQLQQKQEQKEQSQSQKQTEDSPQNQETESTNEQDSNNQEKPQEKGNMQRSIFDFRQNKTKQQTANNTSLCWFIGGSFNGYYQTRLHSLDVNFFATSLHAGIFYELADNHGFKGYASVAYKSLDKNNLFAAGGGIDYFYNFKTAGIFGGIYVDIPIQSKVLRSADVIIQGGMSLYVSPKLRIEFAIGYPIAHDEAIQRSFSYGVSLQYLFKNNPPQRDSIK